MNQKTLITILAILVIILTSSTLYFATVKKTDNREPVSLNSIQEPTETTTKNPSPTKSKQEPQTSGVDKTATTDWKNYQNEKYGFSLTFNNLWTGYQVIEEDPAKSGDKGATAYMNICVPTKSTKWVDVKPGVYCPFTITVVKNDKWEQYQKDNEPLVPTYIAKNNSYTFAYSTGQDSPDEAGVKIMSDYGNIIKTFKVNK